MKKIVHLSKFYKPEYGGLESVVGDICEGFSDRSTVIAVSDSVHAGGDVINGVKVIRSRALATLASTPLSFSYILNAVSSCKNVIIHAHYPNPLANISLFFSWLAGNDLSNLIIHWHSDIVKQRTLLKIYSPLLYWSLKKASVIIVTSEKYLDSSDQLMNFSSKCRVVPIGIDSIEERVDATAVDSIKRSYSHKKIIFALGRHVYYKGFEVLIEAMTNTPDDCVAVIGGVGPDTGKYRQLIEKKGLQDRVFLVGRLTDYQLPNYYEAADVYCLPSVEKSEAFGVVQLEAMSVGTPVVSTDIEGSGVSWVNKNEESGLICSPNDSHSLSSALNRILLDENLRISLSEGAKRRFNSLFTKDSMLRSLTKIYEGLF